MAYDEFMADRIRRILRQKSVAFEEKKMMGGLCILVDDKMCCGLLTDKNTDTAVLMARIGAENYENALNRPFASEMNFTGRSMNGFVFVSAEGIDAETDLEAWVQLCLDYNPFAQKSKKRRK